MPGILENLRSNLRPANWGFSGFGRFKFVAGLCAALLCIFLAACSELEKPKTEPFYAETSPPPQQEFRWSNGKMPRSFDPALAAAPPETDIVRAVFEGLTDTDAKTLTELPGIAEKWTSSDDSKTWVFYLRSDAKWSNGEPLTAHDFVRSWRRLSEMGDKVPHRYLLLNIRGMGVKGAELPAEPDQNAELVLNSHTAQSPWPAAQPDDANSAVNLPKIEKRPVDANRSSVPEASPARKPAPLAAHPDRFGVEAVGDLVLKVSLIRPDADFPSLVSNPIFRPVYGDGKDLEGDKLNAGIVTSGAFRITDVGPEGVELERSETYWNRPAVALERVRFVPAETAELALEAYRAGKVDAVTNADFEPLALKLLTPFEDFRRTTHSALNFYEFNLKKPPYDDRRVREALAISIDRERLTEGEMKGSTQPALGFMPFNRNPAVKLSQDNDKARSLLEKAGYPDGENFPVIRLVVNRNDTQQRIARSVARMWKQNLNVETEIIVSEPGELEDARKKGNFDIVRRGVVMPTADETANFLALFNGDPRAGAETVPDAGGEQQAAPAESSDGNASNSNTVNAVTGPPAMDTGSAAKDTVIMNEEHAIFELHAIPLYFPTSYSLVKPYVQGFEINSLDAPSLKDVVIDNNWQPKRRNGES
jgi:oligopeptide transport system substrate-binding protein